MGIDTIYSLRRKGGYGTMHVGNPDKRRLPGILRKRNGGEHAAPWEIRNEGRSVC